MTALLSRGVVDLLPSKFGRELCTDDAIWSLIVARMQSPLDRLAGTTEVFQFSLKIFASILTILSIAEWLLWVLTLNNRSPKRYHWSNEMYVHSILCFSVGAVQVVGKLSFVGSCFIAGCYDVLAAADDVFDPFGWSNDLCPADRLEEGLSWLILGESIENNRLVIKMKGILYYEWSWLYVFLTKAACQYQLKTIKQA